MTITEAREAILSFSRTQLLTASDREAFSLADQALKTILDMKTNLNSTYGTLCYQDTDSAGMLDLKTLYEQITMYSEHRSTEQLIGTKVEHWEQTGTPIHIYVYSNLDPATNVWTITQINFKLKETPKL